LAQTKSPDALQDRVPALWVHPDCRLVQDEQARPVEEAGADVEPASHAAAVGLDSVVTTVFEVDEVQNLVDALT